MAYETLYIVWSLGNISLHPFYHLRISALAIILPFVSWSLYLLLSSLWFSKAEFRAGTVCLSMVPCVNPSIILCTLHWNHFSSCQKKHGPLDDGTSLLTVCLVPGIWFSTRCLIEFLSFSPPFPHLNCTILLSYYPHFDVMYTKCLFTKSDRAFLLIQYPWLFLEEHRTLHLPILAIFMTWCPFLVWSTAAAALSRYCCFPAG